MELPHILITYITCAGKLEAHQGSAGTQESDLAAVNDERRPDAWTGKISPNVDMAAADLSLNMPTCPSVNIDPNFKVLSPNLLPT